MSIADLKAPARRAGASAVRLMLSLQLASHDCRVKKSDWQIISHAGRYLARIGTFLQKLAFSLIPKDVHPAAGLACLLPKEVSADTDFFFGRSEQYWHHCRSFDP
jgi:hypothetical protein